MIKLIERLVIALYKREVAKAERAEVKASELLVSRLSKLRKRLTTQCV